MKIHLLVLALCGITALLTTLYLVKISQVDSSIEECSTCQQFNTSVSDQLTIDTSSFKFSDNGIAITASVKTNLNKKFNCADLIVNDNVLGQGATCTLSESTMTIVLGEEPSIVRMGGLSVRKHFTSPSVDIATVKWGITAGKRKNGSSEQGSVVVALTADNYHIFKNKGAHMINLEASTASTLTRTYSWKVVNAPSSSAFETLKTTLSTFTSSSVAFSGANLDIGSYIVQVTVRTSRSESASATTSFEIVDGVAPIISIKNQNGLKFIIGNLYIISPVVSFPKEYKGSGKPSNLRFKYTLVKGPSQLTIKQKGDLLVLSNDYTRIPTDGEYTFKLIVQEDGVPDGSIIFKVTATSLSKRLDFEA